MYTRALCSCSVASCTESHSAFCVLSQLLQRSLAIDEPRVWTAMDKSVGPRVLVAYGTPEAVPAAFLPFCSPLAELRPILHHGYRKHHNPGVQEPDAGEPFFPLFQETGAPPALSLSLSLSLSFCVWCTTCQAHGMGGWLEPGLVFVTRGRGSWGFVTRGGGCYWFVKGCHPLPSCTGRSYQGPWVNIVRHPFAPWASCFVSFRSQVRAGHGPWRHAST